jgi:hypothetical protein
MKTWSSSYAGNGLISWANLHIFRRLANLLSPYFRIEDERSVEINIEVDGMEPAQRLRSEVVVQGFR